ncbi:immunoglobulin-like domain-containing protein, partial [Pseudomonas sp. Root401]|uniref:immunoglobulin-like domain-containing protein n=1 Tax=Pseudomonas sp. Root401 TaxID=1736526 RepID=UPI003FA6BCED
MTVTLSNGAVINIAAGATTGTVTVDAPKDDVYKDAGKVEVSIDKATGGNFENLVPSTTPAVTDVTDTIDTSTVSLTATSTVAEGSTVVYTASVNAPVTDAPLVITLSNGQTITIPVGASSGTVNFVTPNDALDAQGGNYEKLDIDATPADTTVTDVQDTTGLTLSATDTVAEGGSIVYTATLTNAAGSPVTVTLSNGAVINIAAGATTGTVTVDAPKDDVYKDAGKVEVSIDKATGGNFENLVPSTTPAVTDVTDTIDTSTVSLTATSTVAEGGTVVYTASVNAPVTDAPLVITLSNGQTITIPVGASSGTVNFVTPNDALAGGDNLSVKIDDAQGGNYEKLDIDATPANTTVTDVQDTTGLTLSATDSVAEGGSIVYTATLTNAAGSPVTVTLSNGAVINIAAGATTGTVTVDAPKDGLSLSASTEVAEGGSIVYTATLTNAAGSPVTVTLSNGAVINIAAGATTGTVTVDAPKDDVYKDAGKVEVSIDKATGGNFENLVPSTTVDAPKDDVYKDAGKVEVSIDKATGGNFENLVPSTTPAVTDVTDTIDTSTVSLTATSTVAEGGTVVYTASVNAPVTDAPLVITLSNGQTITIP